MAPAPARHPNTNTRWLAFFLLIAGPTGAYAQATEPPSRPQSPDPAAENPDALPAPAALPHWQFSMALLGGYDSNVDFRTNEVADYGGSLRASLVRNYQGRRSRFNFSVSGAGYGYTENTDADHVDASLGFGWTQQMSPHATFSLAGFGSYQNTTTQGVLSTADIQLPRAQSESFGGSTGFDFGLGQHGWLRLGGRYRRVTFDIPSLVDSQYAAGDFGLGRRLGQHDEISLTYGYLHTEDDDRAPLHSHFGALGWTRKLSRHLVLILASGIGYNPPLENGITRRWYPYGSLGLKGLWRRTTLAAEVRQAVTPTYGLGGSQLSDIGSLSATVPFGRRVELSLGGNVTWGRERSGTALPYVSEDASLSLNWRLFRYAGLGVGYGYRRNDPDNGAAISAHKAFFGFTYRRP